MQLKAVDGLLTGSMRRVGPPGPAGERTDTAALAGTYAGDTFVLRATYSGGLSGGSYVGQLGNDGRLTGVWTQGVAPYDTASFWFVRE